MKPFLLAGLGLKCTEMVFSYVPASSFRFCKFSTIVHGTGSLLTIIHVVVRLCFLSLRTSEDKYQLKFHVSDVSKTSPFFTTSAHSLRYILDQSTLGFWYHSRTLDRSYVITFILSISVIMNETESYAHDQIICVLWSHQEHLLLIGSCIHGNRSGNVLLGGKNYCCRDWLELLALVPPVQY